jgi:hypothetical protein
MKKACILLALLSAISSTVRAQDEKKLEEVILFRGVVIDAENLSPLSGTNILINGNHFSVSKEDGSFNFAVIRGDTVLFRRVGYKTTVLNVSDTLPGKEFIAGIYMHADTISIGEIVILPGLVNMKNELLNSKMEVTAEFENARNNVAIAAYQGKYYQGRLGDPASNYEVLRQKQKIDAYEKGGIPSDRIAAVSPLLLIPAAYLLLNGLPPRPESFRRTLTGEELEIINQKYLEILKREK